MEIGFVGLGRMGLNMVTRLTRGGHSVIGFDRSGEAVGAVGLGRKALGADVPDIGQQVAGVVDPPVGRGRLRRGGGRLLLIQRSGLDGTGHRRSGQQDDEGGVAKRLDHAALVSRRRAPR